MSDDQGPAALRRKAEALAHERAEGVPQGFIRLTPEETQRTLHELHLRQIELEMQNVELRRVQAELDGERARYFDLYDLAPVGYCTFSADGVILEGSLMAATLLGVARSTLGRQPFARFIPRHSCPGQDLGGTGTVKIGLRNRRNRRAMAAQPKPRAGETANQGVGDLAAESCQNRCYLCETPQHRAPLLSCLGQQ